MVFKFQIQKCTKPADIIGMTLNHFDCIRKLVQSGQEHADQMDAVNNLFIATYGELDVFSLHLIRYTIMNMFKDIRTRVSIFLREGLQTDDGKFIIPTDRIQVGCECQIPGIIRYFDTDRNIECTTKFPVQGVYYVDESETKLGMNM